MFDVLLFAGGLGTRMGNLTQNVAKPALKIGNETLIGRLSRQVCNLKDLSNIYINCSYQPKSIISAIDDIELPINPIFLWEKELMGTAWTLSKVSEKSKKDLLVIHGDLFLAEHGIDGFVKESKKSPTFSTIAVHKRDPREARSVIKVETTNQVVTSFVQVPIKARANYITIENELVWSNSGLYFFQSHDLVKFESKNFRNMQLETTILPSLVQSHRLKAIEYFGERTSVETPSDLMRIVPHMTIPAD